MSAEIRIGTSGWHYKHWRGLFYPERLPSSKMLAYYLDHFDTVELNNTFYRLPQDAALHCWRDSTPENFLFAAKGSRFITHMKKFKDPETALERFFGQIEQLDPKLGPVLFQTPPFWDVDKDRLINFLRVLPPGRRYAFEFRNPSWHTPEVFDILNAANAAFCPFDLAGFQSPVEVTADFTYIRLHGPGAAYQGSYSTEALEGWAARIEEWSRRLKAVYVYFDNDIGGHAVRDALALKQIVGAAVPAGVAQGS